MKKTPPPKAVLIAGMHRSGTSALTRVINLLGAHISSELIPPSPDDNDLGYFESAAVVEFHEDIFNSLGLRWDDYLPLPAGWFESSDASAYQERLRNLVQREMGNAGLWVVKDPRICRFLPLWRATLSSIGITPVMALIGRNPLEVADSLKIRNHFSRQKSLLLWLRYVLEAEQNSRGLTRIFISYDSLMEDWRKSIEPLKRLLNSNLANNVIGQEKEIDDYLSPSLRHHQFNIESLLQDNEIAVWFKRAYMAILNAAEGNESKLVLEMDEIADQLNEIDKTLSFELSEKRKSLRRELDHTNKILTQREEHISDLHDVLAQRDNYIANLENQHTEHLADLLKAKAEIAKQEKAIKEAENAKQQIARLKGELGRLTSSQTWRVAQGLQTAWKKYRQTSQTITTTLKVPYWLITGQLKKKLTREREKSIIEYSGLFDRDYYLSAYPLGVRDRKDPLDDYARNCIDKLRNPNPLFDTSYYLSQEPSLTENGKNPLLHFIESGADDGLNPNPFFDPAYYLDRYPDVKASGINPLLHYLLYGRDEGRDPSLLFQTSLYMEKYPDVADVGMNPLVHYLTYGISEGREPIGEANCSEAIIDLKDASYPKIKEIINSTRTELTPVRDLSSRFKGICIVTPDIVGPVKNGGIGTACFHFAKSLAAKGYKVTILFTGVTALDKLTSWRKLYKDISISFITLAEISWIDNKDFQGLWFLKTSYKVFQFLKNCDFHAIHFQDWQANGFWSIAAKKTGLAFKDTTLTVMMHAPTKWIDEGMLEFPKRPIEKAKLIWCEKYSAESADYLFSPSNYMLHWAKDHEYKLNPQVKLTPCLSPATEYKNRHYQVDNDHLIFFGRLETRKGLDIFGGALKLLRAQNKALPKTISFLGKHAYVEGQPSSIYLDKLQKELKGVKFHVIVDASHEQAMDYIVNTKGLVIISSLVDNCPLTVIECIQSGVPFIAANTGGISELADSRCLFYPEPADLADILRKRYGIDHLKMNHPYNFNQAERTWIDLHEEMDKTKDKIKASPLRQPLVTVCIPHFNHGTYLNDLIHELKKQDYPNVEYVIVDDGSTENNSIKLFKDAARKNGANGFSFLTQENAGPGAARNLAVKDARGELLIFVDADNIPKPQMISKLIRAIIQSGADCVSCFYDIIDDTDKHKSNHILGSFTPIGACLEVGLTENVFGDTNFIIKKDVFDKLGGFSINRQSWEDWEFLAKLCLREFKLHVLPESLFYYRQSEKSRSRQASYYLNYQSVINTYLENNREDWETIIRRITLPLAVVNRD